MPVSPSRPRLAYSRWAPFWLRGGPGAATELISIYIQRVGFRMFDLGMASAQALLLLVITIVLSRIYIRFFYREIE
jgi:multiple sugar transport system permease protein